MSIFYNGIPRDSPGQSVMFLFLCIFFGGVFKCTLTWLGHLFEKTTIGQLRVTYLIPLFFLGCGLAMTCLYLPQSGGIRCSEIVQGFKHEMLITILVPILIFESSFNMETAGFKRNLGSIFTLAVSDLILGILNISFIYYVFRLDYYTELDDIELYLCFIFGIILCATDYNFIATASKRSGNQQLLGDIAQGQDLLSKSISLTAFTVLLRFLIWELTDSPSSAGFIAITIIMQLLASPILGYIFGKITSMLLNVVFSDPLMQILVIISFLFITSFTCDRTLASAPIGVAFFGMNVDQTLMMQKAQVFTRTFTITLHNWTNQILFAFAGILIVENMDEMNTIDVLAIFVFYIVCLICRILTFGICLPFLPKIRAYFNWRHVITITWGGLKHSVSLLSLMYAYEKLKTMRMAYLYKYNILRRVNPNLPLHVIGTDDFNTTLDKMTVYVCGVVLLNAFFNYTTLQMLMRRTGIENITEAQKNTMGNALKIIDQEIQKLINNLQSNDLVSDAKWDVVREVVAIENPYSDFLRLHKLREAKIKAKERKQRERKCAENQAKGKSKSSASKTHPSNKVAPTGSSGEAKVRKPSKQVPPTETEKEFEEARSRLMKVLKLSYEGQQRSGMLTLTEARTMIKLCNDVLNVPGACLTTDDVRKYFTPHGFKVKAKKKLVGLVHGKTTSAAIPPKQNWRKVIFRTVESTTFDVVMQIIIVLNVIPIILDFSVNESWDNYDTWILALQITNYIFIAIYFFEFFFKVIGLNPKQYIRNRWNQFDLIVLILAMIELAIDILLTNFSNNPNTTVSAIFKFTKTFKFLRAIRCTRLLRLSKSMFPWLDVVFQRKIDDRVAFGFDLGKGFLLSEEILSKLLHTFYTKPEVLKRLIINSEHNRIDTSFALWEMEVDNPNVCQRIRTKSAIRTLLNRLWDLVEKKCSEGIFSNHEKQLIHYSLKKQIKKETYFKRHLPKRTPQIILHNITWIGAHKDMKTFFYKRSQTRHFDMYDNILQHGDPCDGIYVIVQGIVKIKGTELQGHVGFLPYFRDHIEDQGFIGEEEELDYPSYLGAGAVVGEYRFLTETTNSPAITCQTHVETLFIPRQAMNESYTRFPQIERKVWKTVAVRIGVQLYLRTTAYEGKATPEIVLHLMKGSVVRLDESRPSYPILDFIREVVLVYGELMDSQKRDPLSCPQIIPEGVTNVCLGEDTEYAILLVIPDQRYAAKLQADKKQKRKAQSY